jgi:hypothetical protein
MADRLLCAFVRQRFLDTKCLMAPCLTSPVVKYSFFYVFFYLTTNIGKMPGVALLPTLSSFLGNEQIGERYESRCWLFLNFISLLSLRLHRFEHKDFPQ